jgi:hypothetical protein
MPYWLSLLAEALAREGRDEEARTVLDASVVAAEERHDNWWLPEVIRLRAGLEPGPGALERLARAVDLASGQSSRTLEARCRADLAGRSVRSPADRPTD